jgi:hypothetical protein
LLTTTTATTRTESDSLTVSRIRFAPKTPSLLGGDSSSSDSDNDSDTDEEAPVLTDRDVARIEQTMGMRLATACIVCGDKVAQIIVFPCRHLLLCIHCAIQTYNLRATHVHPNGMPVLRSNARCVLCRQHVRMCCRLYGVVS